MLTLKSREGSAPERPRLRMAGGTREPMGSARPRPMEFDRHGYDDGPEAVERATFERGATYLRPEHDRARNRLESKLSNRGIPLGSEADFDARDTLNRSQERQMTDLSLASILAGREEHGRLAGLGFQRERGTRT